MNPIWIRKHYLPLSDNDRLFNTLYKGLFLLYGNEVTLDLLNQEVSILENSVDRDQLASADGI